MNYAIEIFTPYFVPTGILLPLSSLEAARAVNKPGAFTLTLPKSTRFKKEFLRKDMVFKVYKIFPDGFRNLLGNTWWFLRKLGYNYADETWTLSGHDTLGLLSRWIVAYSKESDFAEKTIEFGLSDYSDNLIKAFLRENIGTLAFDTTRDLSEFITIEGNFSLGAVGEKEASYQELDKVCADLAKQSESAGTPLYFDLVPRGQKLFFTIVTDQLGTDRSTIQRNIRFDLPSNTLKDATLEWDWENEVTKGFIGGDGEGAAKLVTEIANAVTIEESPFSRVERFFDEGDVWDLGVLTGLGNARMLKNRAKLLLTGNVVDTPRQQFGKDYFYGDKVLMAIDNFQSVALIDAFSIRVVNGVEELDIKLVGETYI